MAQNPTTTDAVALCERLEDVAKFLRQIRKVLEEIRDKMPPPAP